MLYVYTYLSFLGLNLFYRLKYGVRGFVDLCRNLLSLISPFSIVVCCTDQGRKMVKRKGLYCTQASTVCGGVGEQGMLLDSIGLACAGLRRKGH